MSNRILTKTTGTTGFITLNRPEALNACDLAMTQIIAAQLMAWRDDTAIETIILQGAGDKAFCAGGDIRAVTADRRNAMAFFTAEYRLVQLIQSYPKPIAVLMDGITMGGGAGLAAFAKYRIATERTLWAMPETAIGLYPDVCACWLLPHLPSHIGIFLALTGARLRAPDLVALGLATHYLPAAKVESFIEDVSDDGIERALRRYAAAPGEPDLPLIAGAIARCFRFGTMEEIMAALAAENTAWGRATAAALEKLSPTSLKVTLRHFQNCARLTFDQAIEADLALTRHFMDSPDFPEGVRALLIDKDKSPRWQPATLAEVSAAMVDGYFLP
jgi:enoyl-CoA hydratase